MKIYFTMLLLFLMIKNITLHTKGPSNQKNNNGLGKIYETCQYLLINIYSQIFKQNKRKPQFHKMEDNLNFFAK